ncbi:hypothetical protein KDX31_14725 [Amphritea atlantica]|uniref:Uncharacterized protein n=1 Tax=Amphritea atlantica TaxID=355243 RepID=A0ABY5GSN7_9GAMM|nr:hypothetical protein KDX31_14725 [Amphritea atlantica]
MSSVFETVVAGVAVFVIGQIIIKFIAEPILDFRSLLGKITQFFLRYQSQIMCAKGTEEIEEMLFVFASELLQKRQSIILYSYLSCVYGLPAYNKVLSAAKNINLIGNLVCTKENKRDGQVQIYEAMSKIETSLKINIRYNK